MATWVGKHRVTHLRLEGIVYNHDNQAGKLYYYQHIVLYSSRMFLYHFSLSLFCTLCSHTLGVYPRLLCYVTDII